MVGVAGYRVQVGGYRFQVAGEMGNGKPEV
jgi:hypothetical protein